MIVYNQTWLANLRLQTEVRDELDKGNITKPEFDAIAGKYPVGFYTPNIFVRAGLCILTVIIILFGDGLLCLMASTSHVIDTWGFMMFLGVLTYGGLELMTTQNNYYRAGVDDTLTLIAGCQFAISFGMMFHGSDIFNIMESVMVLLISVYLMLRFADMLMSAVVGLAFFAAIFFIWIKIIPAGLATAPFLMMMAASWLYWLSGRLADDKKYVNYYNCFSVMQFVSLLGLYAAGNYYVIQTLSTELAGKTGPVPFGVVFWIWTILMPFVYIAFGIAKKSEMLMRTGLLLVAAAVATFRNYYHVLPLDVSLTIVGTLLLLIVYAITRYLKTPKHGFTVAEPEKVNALDHLKVESLIVAETFAHAPDAPVAGKDSPFGGGSFGGGGSSGGF